MSELTIGAKNTPITVNLESFRETTEVLLKLGLTSNQATRLFYFMEGLSWLKGEFGKANIPIRLAFSVQLEIPDELRVRTEKDQVAT